MSAQITRSRQNPFNNFSTRPLWQWIVVYAIIAIIVYSLVYLFFFSDNYTALPYTTPTTTY